MTDAIELAGYIKFQLANLSGQNGHHTFEQICFHLARRIITPDLVYGTGPVGAGGDQGRDHESFRGMQNDEGIAIVCSIQADGIVSKIKADVDACASSGEPLDAIYAMVVAPVPVARRHELQEYARSTYELRLEILDGETISSQLADVDTFWITARFLGVPASMAPNEPEGPEWYVEARQRWDERTSPATTFGDLEDLRRATRFVVLDDGPAGDLEFWLTRLREVANPVGDRLTRGAFYQLVYLSLFAIQSAHGLEGDIARYYEAVSELEDPAEIEDAQVLLQMISVGARIGAVDLPGPTIDEWRSSMSILIERRLDAENFSGRRAELLFVRAALTLVAPGVGDPFTPESLDAALSRWHEVVEASDATPHFPLSRVAAVVGQLTPALFDRPGYRPLIDELDPKIAERAGQSKAAELARDRAAALYRAGRLLDALDDFHRARIGWFREDTIRGSLLVLIIMSNCYDDLGLRLAAKHYGLAAAGVALSRLSTETQDLVTPPLFAIAHREFRSGNWLTAVEFASMAVYLYDELTVGPWDDPDEIRDFAIQVLAFTWGFASDFEPEHVAAVLRRDLDRAGFGDVFQPPGPWADESEASATDRMSRQLDGAIPFNDARPRQTISWSAHGVQWSLDFKNDYRAMLAAERLAASMQVLHAQLGRRDLCMLPGTVRIVVITGSDPELPREARDTDGPCWAVTLPWSSNADDDERQTAVQGETVRVAIATIGCATLLSGEAVEQLLTDIMSSEIVARLITGGSYDHFYEMFVPEERYNESGREDAHPGDDRPTPVPTPPDTPIGPIDQIGPTYSIARSEELIANRYENFTRLLPLTIARLAQDQEFRALVQMLRGEGWLDWHVLHAIHSLATTYRVQLEATSPEEMAKAGRRWAFAEETEETPVVPLEEFSEDAMRTAHDLIAGTILQSWELKLPGRSIDPVALDAFLRDRYRYYEDDVAHADPFSTEDSA